MSLLRIVPLSILLFSNLAHSAEICGGWQDWEGFKENFVTDSGRVVDFAEGGSRTVSEAQAYALFFALVGNDRESFERVLTWTRDNLASGDLTSQLPGWLWGQRDDESWGVVDDNSASDADLWLSYALLEAGRLWSVPRYDALGILLGRQILRHETAELEGLGRSLLPGMKGFQPAENQWRLNPSYTPLFILRRWDLADPGQGWQEIYQASLKLQTNASRLGLMPNWVLFTVGEGLSVRPQDASDDGYDAIRVYLWAALMSPNDRHRKRLLTALKNMADWTTAQGYPPLNLVDANKLDAGPATFSWALIPFLQEIGASRATQEQLLRVQAMPLQADAYYANALRLFSSGWLERRYRIDVKGQLQPAWKKTCH